MLLALSAALVIQGGGYTPYSYLPPMGWGSSGPTPNPVPSTTNFTEVAYVTDKDTWTSQTNTQVQFGNLQTAITAVTVRSGTVVGVSDSGDADTGKHTYTFLIKANKIDPGTTLVFQDDFKADDLGSVPLKDTGGSFSGPFITEVGPSAGGGGGG